MSEPILSPAGADKADAAPVLTAASDSPPVTALAEQLLAANAKVAELTQANTDLTEALGNAERMLKRVRRNARNSDSTMQDRINVLQNRRG